MVSPGAPLTGGCACGTVRFRVTAPFETAGYCHCRRCQRRSGVPWSLNGIVAAKHFEITDGAQAVRRWMPQGGAPKAFCAECGGHVFAGDPEAGPIVVVRLGAVDGDPGIRPQWHQWLESAPPWEPIPDDGVARFQGKRDP